MNYRERKLKLYIEILSRCHKKPATLKHLTEAIDSSGLPPSELELAVFYLEFLKYIINKGTGHKKLFSTTPAGLNHLNALIASSKPLTDLQKTILDQLSARSYTLPALAKAIGQPPPTVKDALAVLQRIGRVRNARGGVGYYLVDRPPHSD